MTCKQKEFQQTYSQVEAVALMKKLKVWYNNHYKINLCDKDFVECFHSMGTTDSQKAFILLVGKEKWYRGCHAWFLQMRVEVRNEVLKTLEERKPWLNANQFSDFDSLYDDVHSYLERRYISQLIIYDVAIRLAYLSGRADLLPNDKVHLHAKPLLAYNTLVKNGVLSGLSVSTIPLQVERKLFALYLGTMPAIDIENFFCQIGKSCTRIKKGQIAKKQAEQEIDEILKPYM